MLTQSLKNEKKKEFSSEDIARIFHVKAELFQTLKTKIAEFPIDCQFLFFGGILSGGAVASVWHDEQPKDLDIYLTSESDIRDFKRRVIDDKLFSAHVKDINPKYMRSEVEGKLVTANAVTFKNNIQVITLLTKQKRIEFDYIHCMPYLDYNANTFFISKAQVESIKTKTLYPNPKGIVKEFRRQKFLNRGWKEHYAITD